MTKVQRFIIIIGAIVAAALLVLFGCPAIMPHAASISAPQYNNGEVHHVAAYTTPLGDNEIWCAPMQLCWNEAMSVNGDKPLSGVSNISTTTLNEKAFDKSDLGEDHYYIYSNQIDSPNKTLSEISQALKSKFHQSSDVLSKDDLVPSKWLFYSMLYRKFTYEVPFTKLPDAGFGQNVMGRYKYFGVMPGDDLDSKKRDNLKVLYYDDKDHHAVFARTKERDIVVFVKNPVGESAKDIYDNTMSKALDYSYTRELFSKDEFKAPMIGVDVTDDFTDLIGAYIDAKDMDIVMAKQKTRFIMDENGGEVKSEAVMTGAGALFTEIKDPPEPRILHYDDTYIVFLVDGAKTNAHDVDGLAKAKPYFAARIANLDLFQS